MEGASADLLLVSGKLWDGRELTGKEALAIGGGRILAVGTNRDIRTQFPKPGHVVDVRGRRVMPGLIDSHIHLVRAGLRWNEEVRWEGLPSLDEALGDLARAAAARPPGSWIAVVGGWNPHQFTESRPPSLRDLDEAAPRHPVFVQRNYIEAFLNSRALEEMGWGGGAPPAWVQIDPDTGQPSGRVTGTAALQPLRQQLGVLGLKEQVESTRAMLRRLNGVGLTGAIDTGGFGMTPDSYEAFFELWRRGERGFRTRLLVGPSQPGGEAEQLDGWMRYVHPGFGDDYLRYLGAGEVLLFGSHDMEGLDRRDVSRHQEELADLSGRLAERGWPVHLHAILDDSVGSILDSWEQSGAGSLLADLRYTITHADQVGPHNLRRIRDLGLGVTIQNGIAFRGLDSLETWGLDRVKSAPPLRDLLDLGIPVAAGTDATVVSSYNPWLCIWWMVSGESVDGSPARVEGQRLRRDEALRLYTSGSAWFSFEEAARGNLRAGSHADVVVLSQDPLTVPERDLPLIFAEITIVGGTIVHSSDLGVSAGIGRVGS